MSQDPADRPLDDAERVLASELFLGRADAETLARIELDVRSPLEIPYRCFDPDLAGEPHPPLRPTAAHVELAYRLILQRPPESAGEIERHLERAASTAALVEAFWLSPEYREHAATLVRRLASASPRVWHVHVPKTAGTTFQLSFAESGWAIVNATVLATPTAGLEHLAPFLGLARLRRGVLFCGHQTLPSVLAHGAPGDPIVAFVRHPVERLVSLFDFIKGLVDDDPSCSDRALDVFRDRGFDAASFERTCFATATFARNEQCAYLSPRAAARDALDAAADAGCRLCEHERVAAVLRELGVEPTRERWNVSRRSAAARPLSPDVVRRIEAEHAEDLALWEAVRAR